MSDVTPPAGRAAAGRSLTVAFVATAPPRQCGIATFTSDLAHAVRAADPTLRASWAAIADAGAAGPYGTDVRWVIRQGDPASYAEAARAINAADVDVVSVQHEFGLYGIWGEVFEDHLPPFLDALRRPLVTTLHTVLPEPSPSVREAVRRVGRRSQAVVVMAETARRLLAGVYGLDGDTIHVIRHGVPSIDPSGARGAKARLGFGGRTLISTFGLVDPRKGLEYMVGAMRLVAARHPDALYLIAGRTHPELVRREGEAYRERLRALVRDLGLDEHVAFVDRYLTDEQVVEYLLATDIYVTPYLDPNQITSGTLSYALGAGKAVVSTPYLHARESLAEERGLLVPFRSEAALAEAALYLLEQPSFKARLERNAYLYGRDMAWPAIGVRTAKLYREVAAGAVAGGVPPTPATPAVPLLDVVSETAAAESPAIHGELASGGPHGATPDDADGERVRSRR
jgi:glycosyltransferase involved in cell wall biosynthesis